MRKFTVKPKVKGKQVLDPISFKPLKNEGEVKPRDEYWLRRVLDGSIVEIKTTTKEQK